MKCHLKMHLLTCYVFLEVNLGLIKQYVTFKQENKKIHVYNINLVLEQLIVHVLKSFSYFAHNYTLLLMASLHHCSCGFPGSPPQAIGGCCLGQSLIFVRYFTAFKILTPKRINCLNQPQKIESKKLSSVPCS